MTPTPSRLRVTAETVKPSYPHTLTSDQFAIVSVALDSYRERFSDADQIAAIDEIRRLLAFSGPIMINARLTTALDGQGREPKRYCSCQCACTGVNFTDECPHRSRK